MRAANFIQNLTWHCDCKALQSIEARGPSASAGESFSMCDCWASVQNRKDGVPVLFWGTHCRTWHLFWLVKEFLKMKQILIFSNKTHLTKHLNAPVNSCFFLCCGDFLFKSHTCLCASLCGSMCDVRLFIFSKWGLHGAELSLSNLWVTGSWTLGKLHAAASHHESKREREREAQSVCSAVCSSPHMLLLYEYCKCDRSVFLNCFSKTTY